MVASYVDPPPPLSGYEITRDSKRKYKLQVWTDYSNTIKHATYYLSKEKAKQLIKDLQEVVVDDT